MEATSIATQKKLMYIPILNVLNFWLLFLSIKGANVTTTNLIRLILTLLVHTLPICVVFSVAARIFPDFNWAFYFCTIYLGPLSMSYAGIKFQEKNL